MQRVESTNYKVNLALIVGCLTHATLFVELSHIVLVPLVSYTLSGDF